MKKNIVLIFLLCVTSLLSRAPVIVHDIVNPANYPKGYFRNPLGIPIQLIANFGELRSNHFHMGFDIRTNQRENLPVYAAAEGYVSRIKIERSGFGNAIYISHPNGYTTLYAHLNAFYPALQSYIKDKQYTDKKWEQEITFEPDQFPVAKGAFIALSGSTGASEGPHLHFEIRDTKTGNNLNPWLFDFGLADKTPPSVYRLFAYDRRYSTYQTGPVPVAIKGINGNYTSRDGVVELSSPAVSFGLSAEDKTNPSSFRFGIYKASLTVDDSLRSAFQLNDISYNDTRYINASIDYKTKVAGGGNIQYLTTLPGNYSTIFSTKGDGVITLTDTVVHNAKIEVGDANGNTSVLSFKFKWNASKTKGREISAVANSDKMIPGRENVFKTNDLEAVFSYRAFYDTVAFAYRSEVSKDARIVSAVHYLNDYRTPVHDSFTVRIKPVIPIRENLKDRIVMQMISNHKVEFEKGQLKDDFYSGKFRDLGIFKLLLDTLPPRVGTAGWVNGGSVRNRKSISLFAADNAGDIKTLNAYRDGNWILFSRKENTFTHTFDEKTAAGPHELKVIAEDIAGNVTEKNFRFIR